MHPWSFSSMKLFQTCPRKYHAERVLQLYPHTPNKHTIYGHEVHAAAEEYIRDGKELPDEHKRFKEQLDALNKIPGEKFCEQKFAVTKELEPCEFDDKENAWCRGIADLVIINGKKAFVIDYKTGSAKYPDASQLQLMALFVFTFYPEVEEVKAALVFVVHERVVKARYVRSAMDNLWQEWKDKDAQRIAAYETDVWNPKPNGLCRNWCPVCTCEYSGDS